MKRTRISERHLHSLACQSFDLDITYIFTFSYNILLNRIPHDNLFEDSEKSAISSLNNNYIYMLI
jgi:hypothetical protein